MLRRKVLSAAVSPLSVYVVIKPDTILLDKEFDPVPHGALRCQQEENGQVFLVGVLSCADCFVEDSAVYIAFKVHCMFLTFDFWGLCWLVVNDIINRQADNSACRLNFGIIDFVLPHTLSQVPSF